MPYSITQSVADGPITAPRWLQHLIKLCAQHIAPTFALWCLTGHPVLSALLGGPLVWVLITVKEFVRPSDPEPLTRWQHIADWMTDSAISLVPVAFAFAASRDWLGFALLLGACAAAYLAGHKDARP